MVSGDGYRRDSRWADRARFSVVYWYGSACVDAAGRRDCGGEAVTEWTLTVDGGEPVAVLSFSVKTNSIDVSSFGSMYSTAMETHDTIKVDLEKLPCSGAVTGVHQLRLHHEGVVKEYKAVLVECALKSLGSGVGSVRMVWHTVATASFILKGSFTLKDMQGTSYGNSGRLLSKALPALQVEVLSPCEQHAWSSELEAVIIHLNDTHKWSREQIADWLDTLDVDLAFPVPDTIPSNIN